MALDSDTRVVVNKLGAILRLANALDADHLQKVRDEARGRRGHTARRHRLDRKEMPASADHHCSKGSLR